MPDYLDRDKAKALQEKGEAEQKIMSSDYSGARDKLLRAQQLFSAIDGIGSMVAVCDILSAASNKFSGQGIDYYWVLQLPPSSNFSAVKDRYQRLLALLQPIKTKFPGTHMALKLVEDAFSILSNREKRSAYDLERAATMEDYASVNVKALYFQDSAATIFSEGIGTLEFKLQNVRDFDQQHGGIICRQPLSKVSALAQKSHCQDFYNFENDRKPEHFKPGQIWAAQYKANLSNFRYAQVDCNSAGAVLLTWLKPIPVSVGEKRWCDAGLPVACGSFELNPELNSEESSSMVPSYKCSWDHGGTDEEFEIYPRKGEIWALYKDWNLDEWVYNPGSVKGCKFQLVEIMHFSKYLGSDGACLERVDGFSNIFERQTIGGNCVTFHIPPANLYIFSHNVPAYRFKGGEIDKVVEGMFELDQLALPEIMIQEIDSPKAPKNWNAGSFFSYNPLGGHPSLKSYPEEQLLKPSWSSNDFAIGQVWALYSGKDFLPRQYTRIDNLISESQVCVTFLEALPTFDHEIAWKKEKLPIVSGMFEVSGTCVNLEMSQFSCLVNSQKSNGQPLYKIYPLKGEVWALYKNWKSNWKCSDYENYQCQVVQILSDLCEGDVITVARLTEVKGWLTFFHRQQVDGFDLTHVVSRKEMLSFSHQIPAFRVPGIGRYGIPESSWHLEPNALPPKRRN
jgi:curved DNA-binding protein CbpA